MNSLVDYFDERWQDGRHAYSLNGHDWIEASDPAPHYQASWTFIQWGGGTVRRRKEFPSWPDLFPVGGP